MPGTSVDFAIACAEQLVESMHAWPVRAALLWGSVLDVLDGTIPFEATRDIDILCICDNVLKLPAVDRHAAGMPGLRATVSSLTFDVFFADVSYVAAAIKSGRWTVTRALLDGVVLREDLPLLEQLRKQCHVIAPFSQNTAEDWEQQAQQLLSKARALINNGLSQYGMLLVRDALTLICFSRIYRLEGKPPSPSSFGRLMIKHYADSDLLQLFVQVHGINDIRRVDVQHAFLSTCGVLGLEVS